MLLGTWWVLPAALQRWNSKLLNLLLLFIPERSGTEWWPCIIFWFPFASRCWCWCWCSSWVHSAVASPFHLLWCRWWMCCLQSSLFLTLAGPCWNPLQAGRKGFLLLSAPSYLGAYLCCKHFTWANKNSTWIAALSPGNGSMVQRAFTPSRGSDWQASVPGTSFVLLTLILKHLSKMKMWQQSYCFP